MAKCKTKKTPGRKGPRRRTPTSDPKLDEDLTHLASVIAEYQLDNNVHGWFRPPWRDGWNAVGLALEVWQWSTTIELHKDEFAMGIARYLNIVCERKTLAAETYHQAVDDIAQLTKDRQYRPYSSDMMIAALRSYQLLVSNSSGGGHVYNDVLKRAFDRVEDATTVAGHIRAYRCRDSIGTDIELRQDANDRLRRAFKAAWDRGLYLAAYSLPPAVDFSKQPTIVKEPA